MRRRRISLATKALAFQLAGVLAIAGVVAVPRYFSLRTELYAGIESSAESLAQVLEDLLSEHPELLRPGALDAVIDRFAYKLPAVARVSVIGPDARVVADSRLAVGDSTDDPAGTRLLEHVDQRRLYYQAGGQRYLRLTRSLRGRYDAGRRTDIVAVASVDMRLALTDAAVRRELTSEMLLVIVLLFPIGALLYAATRRTFVHPLERLAAAGAQFARGEVPPPLAFSGRDELEAVARSFNEMVAARTSALKERERQLAEAQAIAHVGSWEWDIATGALTWSDEHCRLFGIPVGSPASYEGFVARVHPDDRGRVERIIARGLAERRTEEYEWRLVRTDGMTRRMHTVSIVVTDSDGKAVRMAGTSVDVTERKLAEENQQTLLRELQTALAQVKTLQGWIRICANCKRVLNDAGVWEQFESYVHTHAGVDFSHGICPECAKAWSAAAPEGPA
jgi:PAS domain S-box-containing protein